MLSRLFLSLSSVLGNSQASLEFKWMQQSIKSRAVNTSLQDMVSRRVRGEPLQYILGTQPFGPLNLLTRPPVLIPRPETEHWVIRLSELLSPTAQRPISLLDLGTGSGCIPLLLCSLWPPGSTKAHGVDISPHALHLANDNAALCGISSRVDDEKKLLQNIFTTVKADMLADDFPESTSLISSSFDVITSNPPYISWKEYLELSPSVSDYEDPKSLYGGPDGLTFYHAIKRLISRKSILMPSAIVALEVGHNQAAVVQNMMRDIGCFHSTEIWADPWGVPRTVIARM